VQIIHKKYLMHGEAILMNNSIGSQFWNGLQSVKDGSIGEMCMWWEMVSIPDFGMMFGLGRFHSKRLSPLSIGQRCLQTPMWQITMIFLIILGILVSEELLEGVVCCCGNN
jgi:hypothetical protein